MEGTVMFLFNHLPHQTGSLNGNINFLDLTVLRMNNKLYTNFVYIMHPYTQTFQNTIVLYIPIHKK